jgi:hypothetical protein
MVTLFLIIFYIFWFIITGFIALSPRAAWEILGKWQATSYPSKHYFRLLRLFGILAFSGPLLWILSQFF